MPLGESTRRKCEPKVQEHVHKGLKYPGKSKSIPHPPKITSPLPSLGRRLLIIIIIFSMCDTPQM